MLHLSPTINAPLCCKGIAVKSLYFTSSPGEKYVSVYAQYKDCQEWVPLHIGLPSIPSLQQVRDMDRNISMNAGSYDDAHFYLRSADGNNMTTAYFTNAEGGGIQVGNVSGYAPLNLQPEGGRLNYGGSEVATQNWVQDQGYLDQEQDPTVPAWVKAITAAQISNWDNALIKKTTAVTDFNTITASGIYTVTSGLSAIPNFPHIGNNNNGATGGYLVVFQSGNTSVQYFYPLNEISAINKGGGYWYRRTLSHAWEYKNGVLEIDLTVAGHTVIADDLVLDGVYLIYGTLALITGAGYPAPNTTSGGIPLMVTVRIMYKTSGYAITQEAVSVQESNQNFTRKWIRTRFKWQAATGANPWDAWNEMVFLRDVYTKTQLNTAGGGGQVDWTNVRNAPPFLTTETDPTVPAYVKAISTGDISNWNNKENAANKSTSITLGTSDILYPTQKAVKTYVDTMGANFVLLSSKGVANGVATLGADGKIPAGQLPAIAISNTFVVASQAAMLALSTAETGDIAVRTDISKSFILTNNTPGTLASWQELLSPSIVNSDQVPEGSTNLYFTTGRARASVTAGTGIGYDSATGIITNTAPNVTANLALGTRTATTLPLTNTNGTGVSLPVATTALAGLLSGTDKTKLDGLSNYTLGIASATVLGGIKVGTGLSINATSGVLSATNTTVGTVTNVTGTAPVVVTSGSTTPLISMAQAGTAANGWLSSGDWNNFNQKLDQPSGTKDQYIDGTGNLQVLRYATTNSGTTNLNQYTKLFSLALNAVNQEATIRMNMNAYGHALAAQYQSELLFRVKQGAAFGADPLVEAIHNWQGVPTVYELYYVIAQNTPTTIVDVYLKALSANTVIGYYPVVYPENSNNAVISWTPLSPFAASIGGALPVSKSIIATREWATLQNVTTAGNTTTNGIAITTATTTALSVVRAASDLNPVMSISRGGADKLEFLSWTTSSFTSLIKGTSTSANTSAIYFSGLGKSDFGTANVFLFRANGATTTDEVTGGNLFKIQNNTSDRFMVDYSGNTSILNNGNLIFRGATTISVLNAAEIITTNPTPTGCLALTHESVGPNGVMLDATIKIYLYNAEKSAKIRVTWYPNTATTINTTGLSAYIIENNGMPAGFENLRVGYNGTTITLLIGSETTVWGTYLRALVERIDITHNSFATAAWQTGWALSTGITSVAGFTSLQTIPIDVIANQGWVNTAINNAPYLRRRTGVTLNVLGTKTEQINSSSGDPNLPAGTFFTGFNMMINDDAAFTTQMGTVSNGEWYSRRLSAGVWGSWRQFAFRDWVTGLGYTTNTGTVTSVAATVAGAALNVAGTPVTAAGTLAFTWSGTAAQYINGQGNLVTFPTIPAGTVTSVAATVAGAALNVAGTPVTAAGTLAFTWSGTATQYVNGQGNLVAFPTIPAGTVTSVAASVTGAALSVVGTPITASGTLAFTWAGTAAQYVNGAGGLSTFPAIPAAQDLQNVTGVGNTTTNAITIGATATPTHKLTVIDTTVGLNPLASFSRGGSDKLEILSGSTANFYPLIRGINATANGAGISLLGQGKDDFGTTAAITLGGRNAAGTGVIIGGSLMRVNNYTTQIFDVDYQGNTAISNSGNLIFNGTTTKTILNAAERSSLAVANTGAIVIKHPTLLAPTMLEFRVKMYSYTNSKMAEVRAAFYKSNTNTIIATGLVGFYEYSDGWPTAGISMRVGFDAAGNIALIIGADNTVWGTHFKVIVERIDATFTGYADNSWNKDWSIEIVNDTTAYTGVVPIPFNTRATQEWVNTSLAGYLENIPTGAADFNVTTGKAIFVRGSTNAPTTAVHHGLYIPHTSGDINYGSVIALRNGAFYWKSKEAGTWGAWFRVADRQWVVDQGYTSNMGTVTSVAATMAGTALDVTGTPITGAGTLAFTWSGTAAQYVDGTGNLQTLPVAAIYTGSTSITLSGTSFQRAALTGDVTAAANSNATMIANNAVTTAKINNLAVTDAKINDVAWTKVTGAPTIPAAYNPTAGTGIAITGTYPNQTLTNASPNATHTGDVTGATALTIANNTVTNAKAADMPANTVKVNATAATADPTDLAIPANTILGRATTGNVTALTMPADAMIKTVAGVPTAAVAGTDYLTSADITSGIYTPTFTATLGITAPTASGPAMYQRSGNIITVSGQVSVSNSVGVTSGEFEMTLPIVSALTSAALAGGGFGIAPRFTGIRAVANTSNGKAKVAFEMSGTGTSTFTYMFMYQVL